MVTSRVIVEEDVLAAKLGKWLLEEGYGLADCTGLSMSISHLRILNDAVGLLVINKPIIREYLFGLIKITKKFRRSLVGVIWLENRYRKANYKNWVLEVHGKEYLEQLKSLAQKMSFAFKVKISIRLISDHAQTEGFIGDGDF